IVVNGKKIASPVREEIVTVRGIVPGEYTVNVSHFQATTGQPVAVSVKVQKLNPTAQVIFDNRLTLDHTGEEKTALRFWLDAEGKVVDVQQRQKSLMETFRNVRANGADLDPKTGVRLPRREKPATRRAHALPQLRADWRAVADRAGLCAVAVVRQGGRRGGDERV